MEGLLSNLRGISPELDAKIDELNEKAEELHEKYGEGKPTLSEGLNICGVYADIRPILEGIDQFLAIIEPTWSGYVTTALAVADTACPPAA